MQKKYPTRSGGRVGGVLPPYRDHHLTKVFLLTGGLDMPFAVAQGYSTTGIIQTKNNLKSVGLGTGYALLDQRSAL
jgi:hypothetical protein